MEKLLQLLNEYCELKRKPKIISYGKSLDLFINEQQVFIESEIIISKKFGFIQWLYDEQKIIDDNKMSEVNIIELEDKASGIITDYSLTSENVIMLLAIQDDPISFLVSVLK